MTAADLGPLTDDRGVLTVLAIDHRDSLRAEFAPGTPDDDLVRFKIDVVEAFGSRPSAIMLDPELSIAPILESGRVPAGVGTFCALEAQGYLGDPDAKVNELFWTPAQAKACGASAAKLLVLYRPDRGAATDAQDELIRGAALECRDLGLPLLVEPVPYDIADVNDRERTILRSIERIQELGPDVLKMPFPSAADTPERWPSACRAVNDACDLPWAVLSWGAPFDVFSEQVAVACDHGASGFLAGRAIWKEATALDDGQDRLGFLTTTAVDRFDRLVAATANATPIATDG